LREEEGLEGAELFLDGFLGFPRGRHKKKATKKATEHIQSYRLIVRLGRV
jgi:ABC-type dipeptide/oligopeptide/nickel transport system permease component